MATQPLNYLANIEKVVHDNQPALLSPLVKKSSNKHAVKQTEKKTCLHVSTVGNCRTFSNSLPSSTEKFHLLCAAWSLFLFLSIFFFLGGAETFCQVFKLHQTQRRPLLSRAVFFDTHAWIVIFKHYQTSVSRVCVRFVRHSAKISPQLQWSMAKPGRASCASRQGFFFVRMRPAGHELTVWAAAAAATQRPLIHQKTAHARPDNVHLATSPLSARDGWYFIRSTHHVHTPLLYWHIGGQLLSIVDNILLGGGIYCVCIPWIAEQKMIFRLVPNTVVLTVQVKQLPIHSDFNRMSGLQEWML